MPKLQDLREKRDKLRGEIENTRKDIAARREDEKHNGPILNAEQRTAFDKLKADYLSVKDQCEAEERAADVERLIIDEQAAEERSRRGPGGKLDPAADDKLPGENATYGDRFEDRSRMRQYALLENRRALAFSAWANGGGNLSNDQVEAVRELRTSFTNDFVLPTFNTAELREMRSAIRGRKAGESAHIIDEHLARRESRSVVAGSDVRGNLAPMVTVQAMEKAALTIGGLYNAAEVRVTPDGNKMTWPTANDTSNEGRQIDEVTAQSEDGVAPEVSSFSVGSYEFWSDYIRVGNQTLRDSPVMLASELGMMIGERLARGINRKATSGNGNNTLRGIESAAVVGQLMATAGTFDWQDLYKLIYKVDAMYRNGGTFMMHDEVLVEFMLQTDSEGRPILIDAQDGTMPTLMRKQVVTNNHMATPAEISNSRPALTFGAHDKYKLRLVGQIRTGRYVEIFNKFDQTGFDGKRGADGGLLDAGSHPVKSLAPAA